MRTQGSSEGAARVLAYSKRNVLVILGTFDLIPAAPAEGGALENVPRGHTNVLNDNEIYNSKVS